MCGALAEVSNLIPSELGKALFDTIVNCGKSQLDVLNSALDGASVYDLITGALLTSVKDCLATDPALDASLGVTAGDFGKKVIRTLAFLNLDPPMVMV